MLKQMRMINPGGNKVSSLDLTQSTLVWTAVSVTDASDVADRRWANDVYIEGWKPCLHADTTISSTVFRKRMQIRSPR